MSMPLSAGGYRTLIREDIEWLTTMPRTLEREHILVILRKQHEDAEAITDAAAATFRSDPRNQP